MKKAKRIAIAAAGLFVFGVTSALAAPYQKAQSDGTYAAGNVRTDAEEEAAETAAVLRRGSTGERGATPIKEMGVLLGQRRRNFRQRNEGGGDRVSEEKRIDGRRRCG